MPKFKVPLGTQENEMKVRLWIKCFFGYHFWVLSDATNTKYCYHCNVQREMAAELWEAFKVHEGEYDPNRGYG